MEFGRVRMYDWVIVRSCRVGVVVATLIVAAFCLVNFGVSNLEEQVVDYLPKNGTEAGSKPPAPKSLLELVGSIKEAARVANGGVHPSFSDEERKLWEMENPCPSRTEMPFMYARRKFAPDVDVNEGWNVVLEEYAKLHRTCMRRVGNLNDYFESRNTSTGCKFAIADVKAKGGLGNKVLAITNTIMYAILTQRVVLVPKSTLIPSIMCEPFPGSSWVLDESFPVPSWWGSAFSRVWTYLFQKSSSWKKFTDVFARLDRVKWKRLNLSLKPILYAATMDKNQYHPESRFFCSTEQESFSDVTWLYFGGCLYIVPKLFAIPSFRTILEELFPDRMVLTHILRSVMLPASNVWHRVQRIDVGYLKHADRRVGVQVRYGRSTEKKSMDLYAEMNDVVNERIVQCLIENRILPHPVEVQEEVRDGRDSEIELSGSNNVTASVVTVFIASLMLGFHDHLGKVYMPRATATGEIITEVQLTHNWIQELNNVEVDTEGLIEILTLSFTDHLIITPLSTYGGLAQAYGALIPWFVEFRSPGREDVKAPCQRAQTVDVCYQVAETKYDCPYDADVDGKLISEVVPYIQPCLAIDAEDKMGVQLITNISRRN